MEQVFAYQDPITYWITVEVQCEFRCPPLGCAQPTYTLLSPDIGLATDLVDAVESGTHTHTHNPAHNQTVSDLSTAQYPCVLTNVVGLDFLPRRSCALAVALVDHDGLNGSGAVIQGGVNIHHARSEYPARTNRVY